jgi:hypothetical protein
MRYTIRLYVFPSANSKASRAPVIRTTNSLGAFADQIATTTAFTRSMVKFGDAHMVHIVCETPSQTHEIRIVNEGGLISEREFTHGPDRINLTREYVDTTIVPLTE